MKALFAASFALMLALSGSLVAGTANAADTLASGSFVGKSNHVTNGEVTIKREGGKILIVLEDSFWFDGAPDPKLGFGNSGKYDLQTTFVPLAKNAGKQVYELPAGIDPADYNEFYVWCEKFSVPLGVAALK